jgi:HlyD family secretion protein
VKRLKDVRRRILYLAIGLLLAIALVWAFRPAPIRVDVGQVERGQLQVTVEAEGKTRVRSRYMVAAPVAGRLNRIDLDPGDAVQQGEIVARLDPLPQTARVQEAQARLQEYEAERAGVETRRPKAAELDSARARIQAADALQQAAAAKAREAEASLAQAQRDYQRSQNLAAEGVISRQDLESAELVVTTRLRSQEAAQQEVARATAEAIAAREDLTRLQAEQRDPDYLLKVYDARIAGVEAELADLADEAKRTDMTAPANGVVLRVEQESERYVDAGAILLEIGNPSDLEVIVDVLSSDAVRIRPGAMLLVENWGEDRPLRARVRRVEPSAFTEISALGVEEQRVNVIADFTEPPAGLGDGYRIDAKIVVWQEKDVLKIPLNAIFRCGQGWCVFVMEDGKAQQRSVEIGQQSDFEVAIAQGLKAGETAILYPSETIADGKGVRASAPR